MRARRVLGLCLLLGVLLCGWARCAYMPDFSRYGAGDLENAAPAAMEEILGEPAIGELDAAGLLERIAAYAAGELREILFAGVRSGLGILAVVILCRMAETLDRADGAPDYITLGGSLAIAAACMGNFRSFMGLGTETLHSLSDFSKVLLPTMAAASAAAGSVGAATARYAATALFSDLLITAADRLIVPLVYVFAVLSVSGAALRDGRLAGMTAFLKWGISGLMKVLVLSFMAYLTVSGALAGASDSVTARLTKSALSAALPVVGGILSDAASTVVAGAAAVRGAVGLFGMAAILCVCLVPCLHLGVQFLVYKVTGCLCQLLGSSRLSGLVDALGTAFGLVFALVGSGAVMLFISVAAGIRAVVP